MAKITHVKKRDGAIVPFDEKKIEEAISKALTATNEADGRKAKRLAKKVVKILERRFKKNEIPHVEQIQDIVEEVLILEGLVETAKAYILYREQRRRIREAVAVSEEAVERIDQYLEKLDWEVQENANMAFSLQGLNHYGVSYIVKKYWLNKIYPPEIRKANESGDFHIHNLDTLGPYCMGWDLYDLLMKGFGGVPGKVESKPAKHFNTALMQCVNFLYTLQGECYSEDTQVLTENGWKYFYEVKKGEKVFTLNPKTNKIELQEPYRFYEYDFEGELYNFKSKKADLLVTPGHRMLVDQYSPYSKEKYRKKFVEAKNFNPNTQFIPKGGIWEGKEEKYFVLPAIQIFQIRNYREIPFAKNLAFLTNTSEVFGEVLSIGDLKIKTPQPKFRYQLVEVPEKKILMDDWLKFFGFWLAEGSTTLRKRKRRERKNPYYEYQVRISQNEGKKTEEFEKVLKRLPFNYMKKKSGKKIEFVILNKQLFLYLRQFGKHEEKFIPKEIKNLSKRQLKILFDWMMRGDGYIGNGNIDYYTKSKKLADDIQEIALKLGLSANVYEKRKGKFKWYRVAISKTKHFRFKKENIKKVNYKGKVYCLEVPNHTLYVRRNGKALWCGNCAGAVSFSNFDTLLAPFIRYDNLNYQQVKQALQEFLFNMAIPTRVGFQCPFTNITLDLKPSPVYAKMPVIIGGKPQDKTYSEFEEEMKIFDKALYEVYMEGDAKGRPFHFPIPTINITKDFPWEDPAFDGIFEASAKYGTNYFANYINSEMKPEDVRSMCLEANEEILIRNSKKIKRLTIKDVAENYKDGDFDEEGWAECKKEGNLEVLSLNPETLKLEWVPVKRFLKIKDDKAVEVITEDGKRAIFSMKHPMAIYASNGIQMKFAKDIKIGEKILVTNSLQHLQKIGNSEDKLKLKKVQPISIKEVKLKKYKKLKEFYDIELERNHLFVHSLGQISFNCCRLRLDLTELYNRGGGGLFGSGSKTGSIGVVTINLPRIGYLSKTKKEFFERLARVMDLAKESLEIKRKTIENFIEKGLYPYSRYYLQDIKQMRGKYWANHFSTIGLVGMNECLLNFMGENIATKRGRKFALEVLDFMRERLVKYQEETGNIYNLEATPAESTAYRLALKDKEKYPDIITAGTKKVPYYTNSTQLPVNYTDDVFEALKLQDEIQCKYTGGCIEKGNKVLTDKGLLPIEYIFENFEKLKPIRALSYNKEKEISEWDEIVKAVKIDVSKENKIRIKGERNLDIVTSDWHPFFVLEKIKPNPSCPVCGTEVINIKGFATHLRWSLECREEYKKIPKYRIVEKRADELKVGDYILQNFTNVYPQKESELNNDLMWLIGFFIGDGCISKFVDNRGGNNLKKYKVRFFSKSQEALEKVAKILNKYFGCNVKVIKNDKRSDQLREVSTSKKEVLEFFFKYGFWAGEKVYNIYVPQKVKENFTQENVYAFLSGLMDSDGSLDKRDGDFEYETVSSQLAEDLLEIFTKAGIMVSKILKKTKRKNENDIWRIRIPQYELTKIKEKLCITVNPERIKPTLSNRKKRQLPVVRVKEVSKVDVKDNQFYDLMTRKNHNYLAGKDCLVFVHNTVLHIFLGERMQSGEGVKKLVKKVFENFKLPYITITPTFSICPVHGYLEGEHFFCPKCIVKQPCEVYSRIVGYLRPVQQWNLGKQQEFHQRKVFKISEKEL